MFSATLSNLSTASLQLKCHADGTRSTLYLDLSIESFLHQKYLKKFASSLKGVTEHTL